MGREAGRPAAAPGGSARPEQSRALEARPARSVFGEYIALSCFPSDEGECGVPRLTSAEEIARALRGALLRHAIDPPPAALSGHTRDGRRLERPHAAFLALPEPGVRRGGGSRVAGIAIVLPRAIDSEERQAILLAAARWEQSGLRLVLGRLGAMQLARAETPPAGDFFDTAAYIGPARRWASLTPIALHRNPGKLTSANPAIAARAVRRAEEIVSDACEHTGLPRPANVCVMRRSTLAGIPSAPEFMPFPRKPMGPASERFQRVCVHAELEFAEPVEGPVLLGAGRYFGVGVCRALIC